MRLPHNLRWFLGLWLGIAIALVGMSSPLRAEAATGWGSPTVVDSTSPIPITSVSCPTSSFCMAVDQSGNALIYNGTSWTSPTNIDGANGLVSVSCPTSSFCMAVDQFGNAMSYNGTSWSSPADIDDTNQVTAVSCSNSTFCMTVDNGGYALRYNGTSWSSPSPVDPGGGLLSVSCPSSNFCVAVDWNGNALSYSGTSWSAPASIDSANWVTSVSCATSAFCMAVDLSGNAVSYNGASWSAAANIDGAHSFVSVSCPSSTFCVGLDQSGNGISYNGTSWSSTANIDGAHSFVSVSCPSRTFCVGVDQSGDALSYSGTSWSLPTAIDVGPAWIPSISCPSSIFCMAVDVAGNAVRYNGSSWSSPISIDGASYLNAVSCPSSSFCMAMDGAGNAFRYNGSSWSSPTSVDNAGGLLNSVSCPSSSFCMAVDEIGNALSYNGTSWNSPASVDSDILLSVSCPSPTSCVAVDISGHVLRYNGTSWSSPLTIANNLTSVSCPSTTFCAAVGFGGDTFLFNGTTWTSPASVDGTNGLDSISCPSSSFCMAVDESGNALSYDGTSWTSPTSVDSTYLTSVSCPSSGFCMAVDNNGNAFRYMGTPAPTVTGVNPSHGSNLGGATITVSGTDLTGATAVYFGTHLGSGLAVVNATTVTVTSPPGTGTVGVTVTTPGGATALTPADTYTYESLPVISAVTPSAGPVTGGQVVTVTGSGFVAGMTATIGGAAVMPTGITASSFSFTTPAHAAGYVQVEVTNAAGASVLTPAAGYIYSGLGSFVPVTPFRIMDTRSGRCGIHSCGALGAGQTLALQITGYSVPANATAVVLNVLAVNGSSSSLLTVWPSGTGRPLASNLNFSAHENIANLVTVALGQNGTSDSQREVNLYNALGTVNVVADVEGYFVPEASSNPAGEFHAIAPLRVCDTRAGQPANGCNLGQSTDNRLVSGQVMRVNVSGIPSGVGGSPASIPTNGSAGAAVLNLTAVAGTQATWLSVFPTQSNGTCLTSQPASSTINVLAGGAEANRLMVPLGPSRSGGPSTDVCVYNAVGTINVVLDAGGWFGSSSGPAFSAQYQAIGPTRICDTRSGTGTLCSGHQLTSGGTLLVAVAGVSGIPGTGPVAIIANLTAVIGSQPTYLTIYPADVSPKPNASDVNLNPGIAVPNLVVVGLATGAHAGDLNLYNAAGSINAVLDVDGWFQ
jgi:hypothetical protein